MSLLEKALESGKFGVTAEMAPPIGYDFSEQMEAAALLNGKRVASIVTCGYRPDRGADLWEEGLRRWCKHGRAEYLGMFCRRDLGKSVPFMDEEKESGVRDFAQAIYLSIRMEEV